MNVDYRANIKPKKKKTEAWKTAIWLDELNTIWSHNWKCEIFLSFITDSTNSYGSLFTVGNLSGRCVQTWMSVTFKASEAQLIAQLAVVSLIYSNDPNTRFQYKTQSTALFSLLSSFSMVQCWNVELLLTAVTPRRRNMLMFFLKSSIS